MENMVTNGLLRFGNAEVCSSEGPLDIGIYFDLTLCTSICRY